MTLKTLKDTLELIVFKHSIFALPFIFTAMFVASKSLNGTAWFGSYLLIFGVLCAISARNFAMGVNRYHDAEIDALNPRTASRPSVDGRIGKSNMKIFIAINALIFVLSSAFINSLAFWLSFPFLLILASYSYFKSFSALAHVILGLCLGLSPIAGAVAVLAEIPLWSVLLCCGVVFWVAGFDVLYALQDMEFDKKMGLFSIPSRFGHDASMAAAALFHALAVLFWLFFAAEAGLGGFAYVGILVCAFMLYKEHLIVRKDFSKIDRAFFTLNGWVSVAFMVFVWMSL